MSRLFPRLISSRARLLWIAEAYARGVWGERRLVPVYLVDVTVGSDTLPGVYAVGDDLGDEVILGRNILNWMRLLLDGPAELTEVIES